MTRRVIISPINNLHDMKFRYNKVDDTWTELGAKLPERNELMSAMFVENIC